MAEMVVELDAGWALDRPHEAGRLVGSGEYQLWAEQAHQNPPVLHTHDRYGHRADEVRYHPAYHEITRRSVQHESLFKRMATAVMKYWVCKRGPNHAFEALECPGGNGYTEASPLARRYRQQPLPSSRATLRASSRSHRSPGVR